MRRVRAWLARVIEPSRVGPVVELGYWEAEGVGRLPVANLISGTGTDVEEWIDRSLAGHALGRAS